MQPSGDHCGQTNVRRKFVIRSILIIALAAIVVIVVALAALAVLSPAPSHTHLTVVNLTPFTVTEAGFTDHDDERSISVGPIHAGQSADTAADFDAPDSTGDAIPIGFSFDLGGRTFSIPLAGRNIANGTRYTMTIMPGQVAVVCVNSNGTNSSYVQVPAQK